MLRITQISSSGFTGPDAGDGSVTLHSSYESVDNFVVDITFEGMYEVITPGEIDPLTGLPGADVITYVYQNATDVTSTFNWSAYGMTMTKPNAYTIRISGPSREVFPDQYYKFVLPDLTQQILPSDTTVPFYSIIKYHKPASNSVALTYPIDVTIPSTYGSGSTVVESTSLSHTHWWSVAVASANIARLKTQGLR